MTTTGANLRKAAIFVRSVDADTAASLLAQLSLDEAAAIREAIRRLGPLDADEQAVVLAELQRGRPATSAMTAGGVELELSAAASNAELPDSGPTTSRPSVVKRFEFLDDAPISGLVRFLAREHSQTIAVVLSHLEPARAAAVLAALPPALQVDTIERLTDMGESDPESVTVLEKELADWVAERATSRRPGETRNDRVGEILAAADGTTREGMLRNLKSHNIALADRIAPNREQLLQTEHVEPADSRRKVTRTWKSSADENRADTFDPALGTVIARPRNPGPPAIAPIDFDHLIHLDRRTLATVLRDADANVLALALAGSSEELVDRICEQMPKRIARAFRRELRRLGPTRLSDVEAAQRAVARSAAQHLAARRRSSVALHG